jgi:hypothetical protein
MDERCLLPFFEGVSSLRRRVNSSVAAEMSAEIRPKFLSRELEIWFGIYRCHNDARCPRSTQGCGLGCCARAVLILNAPEGPHLDLDEIKRGELFMHALFS